MFEEFIGKEIEVDGEKVELVGVRKASRPHILINKPDLDKGEINISTPKQYDITVRLKSGKTRTIKNIRL